MFERGRKIHSFNLSLISLEKSGENTTLNILYYNSTKYWQERLNNGYRGISI